MATPSREEQLMLELINEERAAEGLDPLSFNGDLLEASEDHSEWMLETDRFSHTGQGGSSAGDRIEEAGYQLEGNWTWGENIAWQTERGAPGIEDDVRDLHESLMQSPGHRANILDPDYDEIGIGIERGDFDGRDSVMVTQNFAASDAEPDAPPAPAPEPEPEAPPAPEPDVVAEPKPGEEPVMVEEPDRPEPEPEEVAEPAPSEPKAPAGPDCAGDPPQTAEAETPMPAGPPSSAPMPQADVFFFLADFWNSSGALPPAPVFGTLSFAPVPQAAQMPDVTPPGLDMVDLSDLIGATGAEMFDAFG